MRIFATMCGAGSIAFLFLHVVQVSTPVATAIAILFAALIGRDMKEEEKEKQ